MYSVALQWTAFAVHILNSGVVELLVIAQNARWTLELPTSQFHLKMNHSKATAAFKTPQKYQNPFRPAVLTQNAFAQQHQIEATARQKVT